MPSYYYPQLRTDSREIILENDEYYHLSRVKRIRSGARIMLNGGNGLSAECRVVKLEKRCAVLEAISIKEHPAPEMPFAIAFSLLKNHHDELVVEKCTELGASAFFPLLTEYTVRDEKRNTIFRFEKIALAAIKQCDNPYLPTIHPILNLEDALPYIRQQGYQPVLCSESEQQNCLYDTKSTKKPCFIIGPEGGFSEADIQVMQEIPSISICKRIVRAETAAICIASQYQLLALNEQY
ncbi:MAG: RsmE family RNA methyltransferase [Candidatus Cloacimonetes bacterium]|jgi:16S rRNA (uracil1498-N3)-methyltransferase|nr:16S rRNA (uracil(1498)-N(3))-methyltransferase [Candidatus Cloacimonadota bacterium]MDD2506231.1 RsmE family RNA methyltransferase [Candidatus Cloacimonadota bacterium]MDD4147127.1 RsmE family RNA methyltransferase [Candidatus Cloacimonadota bacterium]MDD4559632.1 RsmE family RNA methyltransferase [Candidatus Cloacimonadota bacterium]